MLEILASVLPCRERPFACLEHLVLNYAGAVSGCICVLLGWDEPRRELIRKLKSLGLPLLVLVVLEPGLEKAAELDAGPMRDEPDRFLVVQAGRVEETLAKLR
jgi:hypothetical protein